MIDDDRCVLYNGERKGNLGVTYSKLVHILCAIQISAGFKGRVEHALPVGQH